MADDRYLVFALGPVQAFVSQARRTADSWAGSYLLSYLAGTAALAIEKLPGVALVEPPPRGVPMLDVMREGPAKGVSAAGDSSAVAAIPNTVVVQLGTERSDPRGIGAQARKRVGEEWETICRDLGRFWTETTADATLPTQWNEQTIDAWETYWAWGKTSVEAYRHLSMRKALRDFKQVTDHGERCTVCGVRGAMCAPGVVGVAPGRIELKETWKRWATAVNGNGRPRTLIRQDGSERLCALCTVKRLLPWIPNPVHTLLVRSGVDVGAATGFPSTSTMATVHYRCEILTAAFGAQAGQRPGIEPSEAKREDLSAAVRVYRHALEEANLFVRALPADSFKCWDELLTRSGTFAGFADWLQLDGDLYLFGHAVVNEEGLDSQRAKAISRAYRDMLGAARAVGVRETPIYWALLTMDGDNLGVFLKRVASAGIPTTAVSALLQQFASSVPATVRQHNGRVVYAGGDDVVAMFPLVDALPAADALRQAFATMFRGWFAGLGEDDKGSLLRPVQGPAAGDSGLPTLSGAIVYAHHQAPLGQVFASAHELLDQHAKKVTGKNAIALRKLQAGSAALTCAAPWEPQGAVCSFPVLLATVVERLVGSDGLSVGLINSLRDASDELVEGGFVKDRSHRVALLARRIEKSRGATMAGNPGEVAEELLALADAATRNGATSIAIDPLLFAAFLRGEGREVR